MSANKLFIPQPFQNDILDVTVTTAVPVVGIVLICPETDRVAIFQRNSSDSGAGDWEFPGGKVESRETLLQAVVREVQEEISIALNPEKIFFIGEITHCYPTKTIHLMLFRYEYSSKISYEFKLVDHQDVKWVSAQDLFQTNLSGADLAFLKRLISPSGSQT